MRVERTTAGDISEATATAPVLPLALRLANVGVRSAGVSILSGIDLEIGYGAPTLLMGPNGSGKTTLLRVMMQLAEPSEGHLEMLPAPDGSPARRSFVFQKPVMLKRSAAENIAFAMTAQGHAADPARVAELLQQVGLTAHANRPARKMSGGEQQRLALARALARNPHILFLDEPTASLDPAQTKAVEEIIASVAASGVKVVMSTHDLGQARRIGGEVALLVGGRVVEKAPAATFLTKPATDKARRFLAGELVI